MRTILIDPADRTVAEVDLPDFLAEIRRRFGNAKLARVETLPRGDRLHVVVSDAAHTMRSKRVVALPSSPHSGGRGRPSV
jgi:hypothetical protein